MVAALGFKPILPYRKRSLPALVQSKIPNPKSKMGSAIER